ncbi:acyl-CoA dehydrogenase [Ligilactobacillus salitolerans]|uniref:Acyl-CoA dehydrogenase n=1 Tax=Ligilactobacillus salitolerans TaxID=1808352 RepID=A0A401IQS6_9LACO|nr:acyl-CoA dehydrogenase family protein [Ligilactobacillus salitolerans]GBG93888.1 acyl-CoA dehydrogenase [Ligilactobacillus salitolerans]
MHLYNDLFTPAQKKLLEETSEYTETRLAKDAKHFDETGEYPQELLEYFFQKKVFELVSSGDRADLAAFFEIIRIVSTKFAALASIMLTQAFYAIVPVSQFGTESQKSKLLAQLVDRQKIGAFGLTEESETSQNSTDVKTVAWETKTGWEISGEKKYLSNAPIADVFLIVAATRQLDGKEGQGLFIIDQGTPGLKINEPMNKMGVRSLPVAGASLNHVKVSADSLLGQKAEGKKQVEIVMNLMKLAVAIQALGIAQGSFTKGLDYLNLVRRIGNRLIDNQDIQYRMADLRTNIYSAEAFVRQIILTDPQNTIDVAMAKLLTANVAVDATETIIQLTGGYGYMKDSEIERYVRDAKITAIYGGSSRSQKEIIAKHWIENR